MPNVVRNMIAARIIKQYVSYCKEITFNHLRERELYRVLKYCPAQQKKALQGLDNISADGLCGVEKLQSVIRKLGERGKSSEWVTGVINILMNFKSYLKDSYHLQVSMSSTCQDHCSTFAWSDPSEPEFSKECHCRSYPTPTQSIAVSHVIIETGRQQRRGTQKENKNNKAVGQVFVLTLSGFSERTRANLWRPCQGLSLKEFYLNVATERQNRGALWYAFAKRNNFIVSCFDRIIFVDSIACYASDWKV